MVQNYFKFNFKLEVGEEKLYKLWTGLQLINSGYRRKIYYSKKNQLFIVYYKKNNNYNFLNSSIQIVSISIFLLICNANLLSKPFILLIYSVNIFLGDVFIFRGSNIIMGKIVDGGGSNILMGKIVDDDLQFRGKIHDYSLPDVCNFPFPKVHNIIKIYVISAQFSFQMCIM